MRIITAVFISFMLIGCGGGGSAVPPTVSELTPNPEPETAQTVCENAGGRYEADGSCTSAEEIAAEMEAARLASLEMACVDAGGRWNGDDTCSSAADLEAERLAALETQCTSGGGQWNDDNTCTEPEVMQYPRRNNLDHPLRAHRGSWYDASRNITWTSAAFGTQHYGTNETSLRTASDAKQHPVYHDSSHFGGLGLEYPNPNRRLFVGVDQNPEHFYGSLPFVRHRGNVDVRFGRMDNGVRSADISTYRTSGRVSARYDEAPVLRIVGTETDGVDVDRIVRAVQLVNAALPIDRRMSISIERNVSFSDRVSSSGRHRPTGGERGGSIYLEMISSANYHGTGHAWGTAWNFDTDSGPSSYIQVSKGAGRAGETTNEEINRRAVMLMAHEIMHALGVEGHVVARLDSIMVERNVSGYPIPDNQPLSLLYPLDRAALRSAYDPDSLGSWDSQSLHVHGNGPHIGFGVAMRNGYAEPWAYGWMPERPFTDLRGRPGSATWEGELLGFTPEAEAVAGDARINIGFSTMTGSAQFDNLEHWNANEAPGKEGTGTTWGDGGLRYFIRMDGNSFESFGGDDGTLTGIITGPNHEGAGGVLERDDLTAAFGAERQ